MEAALFRARGFRVCLWGSWAVDGGCWRVRGDGPSARLCWGVVGLWSGAVSQVSG